MLDTTFRKCGHSSALLNVDSTFEFLECTWANMTLFSHSYHTNYIGIIIKPWAASELSKGGVGAKQIGANAPMSLFPLRRHCINHRTEKCLSRFDHLNIYFSISLIAKTAVNFWFIRSELILCTTVTYICRNQIIVLEFILVIAFLKLWADAMYVI